MTTPEASTTLSVRGEAQRATPPDEARVFLTLHRTADSRSVAVAEVQAMLSAVTSELAGLGGEILTPETARTPLTWSAQSIRTEAEYDHDKRSGSHGPTGRQVASVTLLVTVRDFTRLPPVSTVLTDLDSMDVQSVQWSVDDDNAEWALVRADAIQAALLKGRDYAAALGGRLLTIDHVADAGLLAGDSAGRIRMTAFGAAAGGVGMGGEGLSLDPVPQVVSATIEARFTAVVSALPGP
ncbi:uncharacterized protein YggE [Nakamurella sp. UYEF19]|uniref:SIMPL domain-containing protein n=1 Tax=Nakamurella sp. UYEF19 TaxID=1756392 RepID=UPI00339192C2